MWGCHFYFVFVYFVIKVFDCSPVPASLFPYLRTVLQTVLHHGNMVWQRFGGGIAVACKFWIKDWERWVVSQGKSPAFVYCRHESAHSLSAICNKA